MRLSRRDVNLLKNSTRTLRRSDRRKRLLQLHHGRLPLNPISRHVGGDHARADGEDDWIEGERGERGEKLKQETVYAPMLGKS